MSGNDSFDRVLFSINRPFSMRLADSSEFSSHEATHLRPQTETFLHGPTKLQLFCRILTFFVSQFGLGYEEPL